MKKLLFNQTATVELTDEEMLTKIIFAIILSNGIWNSPMSDTIQIKRVPDDKRHVRVVLKDNNR